jgi:uncharacterized protein YhaN
MASGDTPLTTPEAALDALLAELEAEERLVSQQRRVLFDRIDVCIDDRYRERYRIQEREISERRRELHARIDAVRAERDALSVRKNVPARTTPAQETPTPSLHHALLESAL